MTNIRAELGEIKKEAQNECINSNNHKTKVSFLKTNKTDKPLAKLMQKKRRRRYTYLVSGMKGNLTPDVLALKKW